MTIKDKIMIKEINLCGKKVTYNLQYKRVKNINLRIKTDCTLNVSASPFVSQKVIEEFLLSKSEWIIRCLEKYKNPPAVNVEKYREETELKELITKLCSKAYLYYKPYLKSYPQIKFKKTKSRWGSCIPTKGILCFSTNLVYAPYDCVEYVVYHEFTHFLQTNHSDKFYTELEKVYPYWKECRKKLKKILIG